MKYVKHRFVGYVAIGSAAVMLCGPAARANSNSVDETAIRAAMTDITKAYDVKDADRAMASYATDVHVFDLPPPIQQIGKEGNLRTTRVVMAAADGHMTFDYEDVNVVVTSDANAYSTAIVRLAWKMKDGSMVDLLDRTTDIWKKIDGRWLIVHEHNSVPIDMVTGKAVMHAARSGHATPFADK